MGATFRGGVPYSIDIERLTESYPIPSLVEGLVIDHAELEGVVRSVKGSKRYYGVLNSWINQMKVANGIFIVWKPSVGVEVLDPASLLTHAEVSRWLKLSRTMTTF